MSGDGYSSYSSYYHHPPGTGAYPVSNNPPQQWNNWNLQYMQNYARNSVTYNSNALNHSSHNGHNQSNHTSSHNNFRPQGYHTSPTHTNRYYRNRYNSNSNNQYSSSQQHVSNWQRNQNSYNKRSRLDSTENEMPQLKTTKKKKKPLSQNIPKKEWTMDDAEQALAVEKEHNKKSKNALIIKFPDQELNKDIVSQFHSSIENVHFQQPCTPRFCFVTLQESADPEEVISVLNKQKFGDGYLSAEYKKDREEDQAISAEDIDPLTLYVGNLAQEITKEDMVNMYPNSKRIDIGFAKKMKFTRYAFVAFRYAADSIEAFKNTHSKQMYNKSLIVRFRRLHGTVGMPGESKPQNPPKNKEDVADSVTTTTDNLNDRNIPKNASEKKQSGARITSSEPIESRPRPVATPRPTEICNNHSDTTEVLHLDQIKQEQPSPSDSGDEINHKLVLPDSYSPVLSINGDEYVSNHRLKIEEQLQPKIKKENDKMRCNDGGLSVPKVKTETVQPTVRVKDEPHDSNYDIDWSDLYYEHEESDGDDDDDENVSSNMMDFDSEYERMVNHANKINSLKKAGT